MDAALSILGLARPCSIHLEWDDLQVRRHVVVPGKVGANAEDLSLPLFDPIESVTGQVRFGG